MFLATLKRWAQLGLLCALSTAPLASQAAPYAALVMDARSGEVLYAKNADARLHPASLTKMMTLYVAFSAIERGEISLDTMVTVSANAAAQPPSRLGLRKGQKIAMRYLIRAAAVKSANDAASAIGDAVGGDEARFAARMNATAKALGMKNSHFENANGLDRPTHLSSARDMSLLGRRLFYDFPQYYNLFSRRSADAGIAQVASTNRRFLDAYEGADGIKTGYTSRAGFNLVASAERGNKRIIATVFGGTSTAQRNAKVSELLDLGFGRAPKKADEDEPAPVFLAEAPADAPAPDVSARKLRVSGALEASSRPRGKPQGEAQAEAPEADAEAILAAVAEAAAAPEAVEAAVAEAAVAAPDAAQGALNSSPRPLKAPRKETAVAEVQAPEAPEPEVELAEAPTVQLETPINQTAPQPETLELARAFDNETSDELAADIAVEAAQDLPAGFTQSEKPQPETLILASVGPRPAAPREEQVVIARASTSGGRHWGISLGLYQSEYAASRALLQMALMESETLGASLRKVNKRKQGFEANFVGLSEDMAALACRKIAARSETCEVVGP